MYLLATQENKRFENEGGSDWVSKGVRKEGKKRNEWSARTRGPDMREIAREVFEGVESRDTTNFEHKLSRVFGFLVCVYPWETERNKILRAVAGGRGRGVVNPISDLLGTELSRPLCFFFALARECAAIVELPHAGRGRYLTIRDHVARPSSPNSTKS